MFHANFITATYWKRNLDLREREGLRGGLREGLLEGLDERSDDFFPHHYFLTIIIPISAAVLRHRY